jgi:hypothetical protein
MTAWRLCALASKQFAVAVLRLIAVLRPPQRDCDMQLLYQLLVPLLLMLLSTAGVQPFAEPIASPTALHARTVRKIMAPGKIASHGSLVMVVCA